MTDVNAKVVAASRVAFAYARDDCFGVLSGWLKQVNRRTRTPVNAVWFNAGVGAALVLLVFGGTAIDAVFSIGALSAYVAFATPIFIRVIFVGNRFRPGPWHLGRLSLPSGLAACAFVAVMLPVLCFPA